MDKLMLVDGNSMLFRAYFATAYTQRMTTQSGLPTNAVYGFSLMLDKAIELIQPKAILVAFDAGKKTFRHEVYKDYKAGRKATPEELVSQFPLIRDFLDAYGIKRWEIPGIEADDIVGSMTKRYPDWDINILTSDRDLLQLVDATTSVWLMKKGLTEIKEVDPSTLKEELGLTPEQICDLKGLMGDASDHIPGIAGIGEKTALKLLAEYHTVENLLDHTEELKGKLKEKVEAGKESALMSKQLATIKTDADLPFTVEDCLFHPQWENLHAFYLSLDMKSLATKVEGKKGLVDTPTAAPVSTASFAFEEVDHVPASFLKKELALALDLGPEHFMDVKPYGFALSDGKKTVYILLEQAQQDQAFMQWLQEDQKRLVWDVKRAGHGCNNVGITLGTGNFDTMIAANLVDSALIGWDKVKEAFDLPEAAPYEAVYGRVDKPKLINEEERKQYTATFAQALVKLASLTQAKLQEFHMVPLFQDIEMPLARVLEKMETQGIGVDRKVLDQIADKTKADLDRLQANIYQEAGLEFNINSPKQLGEVLYDQLGLPSGKKRSTSADVLEKLIGVHPIIASLLEYRKVAKLYSTYAEGLKKYIQGDGKIHTCYNQCITQTGRLSSSDPNLQNISVRDERAKEIRKAFVAPQGHVFLSSDYSQVELRMLAHMAKEKGLIAAFQSGLDIHTKTAMDVFGVKKDEVDSGMRRKAKAVNFGIVYGISDFGLAEQIETTRKEAHEYIEAYYKAYPGIRTYMDQVVQDCEKNGYVTTITGRRREIPEIHDRNHMVREFGKRAAMNAPIQGSAADLIKIAMIAIQKEMDKKKVQAKMILQVHDELIFDVPLEEVVTMQTLVQEGMEHAMDLLVPLLTDIHTGSTWWEAK